MQKSPLQLSRTPSIIGLMDEIYALKKELVDKIEAFDRKVAQVKQGPVGPQGLPGNHAPTIDEEALIKKVAARVPRPLNGTDHNPADIIALRKEILKLQKPTVEQKKLTIQDVDGLEQTMHAFKTQLGNAGGYMHGGGDTVSAGPNITITNTNGTKVISAVATSLTIIAVTGTIDDANVSFMAASQPTLLNINGAFYQKTGGSYTWTYVAGTITLSTPVGIGGQLFGI